MKKGTKVVLSDSPTASVYNVMGVDGLSSRLGYTTSAGMRVDSGWFDTSLLQIPTPEQLANA